MPCLSALSSRRGRMGTASTVYEHRVGGEHRAAVEERRPQLLAFAGHAAGGTCAARQPITESIARCGVGHPEAQIVAACVAFAHRTLLVLEPGGCLVERVEAAEASERTLEASVRPHQVLQ